MRPISPLSSVVHSVLAVLRLERLTLGYCTATLEVMFARISSSLRGWLALAALLVVTGRAAAGDADALLLDRPATNWMPEALPVGNGRLGARLFGGVKTEHLLLNEDTLWSGRPDATRTPALADAMPELRRLLAAGRIPEANALIGKIGPCQRDHFGAYQPLGDLYLDFPDHSGKPEGYRRELDLTTDQRIPAYATGKGGDPELEALLFHYERYLLAASSRPGGLPADLQGLWNGSRQSAWDRDYHTDINLEMNY